MSGISQFLQKIVVYLRYYFKANTRYRFHSPYLFHLIESCFVWLRLQGTFGVQKGLSLMRRCYTCSGMDAPVALLAIKRKGRNVSC